MATILCIEDEDLIREDIVETLKSGSHDVLQARDGQEGLEMILEHQPDLVVSDINMPRKDGYELLREIREKHPRLAEMPFIFLSALADRERVQAGLQSGADCYLTKPIDFETLLITVQASIRQMERIKKLHQRTRVRVLDI